MQTELETELLSGIVSFVGSRGPDRGTRDSFDARFDGDIAGGESIGKPRLQGHCTSRANDLGP